MRTNFKAKATSIYMVIFVLAAIAFSCRQNRDDSNKITSSPKLTRIINGDAYELGVPCGYKNEKGDTIIPVGKYVYCFSDTIANIGIVGKKSGEDFKALAINQKDSVLYEVYWYDNGPDEPQDGLFRIIINDKIGYADLSGNIIIKPQYACTTPFKNGRARVTFECKVVTREVDGHGEMISDSWFFIDTKGNRVN